MLGFWCQQQPRDRLLRPPRSSGGHGYPVFFVNAIRSASRSSPLVGSGIAAITPSPA